MLCHRSWVRILPRANKKLLLLVKFSSFFQVFENQNLPKKLFLPETNFDFTNVWSEMLPFRDMAISFGKFWSWTPCSTNFTKQARGIPIFFQSQLKMSTSAVYLVSRTLYIICLVSIFSPNWLGCQE